MAQLFCTLKQKYPLEVKLTTGYIPAKLDKRDTKQRTRAPVR